MPERSFFGLNHRTIQRLLLIVFGVVLLILNNHDIVPFEPHSWFLWLFLGFVAIGLFHIFVRPPPPSILKTGDVKGENLTKPPP